MAVLKAGGPSMEGINLGRHLFQKGSGTINSKQQTSPDLDYFSLKSDRAPTPRLLLSGYRTAAARSMTLSSGPGRELFAHYWNGPYLELWSWS